MAVMRLCCRQREAQSGSGRAIGSEPGGGSASAPDHSPGGVFFGRDAGREPGRLPGCSAAANTDATSFAAGDSAVVAASSALQAGPYRTILIILYSGGPATETQSHYSILLG